MPGPRAQPWAGRPARRCRPAATPVHTLGEIGRRNRLLREYLRRELPSFQSMIGLDLSEQQMVINRARMVNGIRYEAVDAAAWLPANMTPGWVLVSNGGGLECFLEIGRGHA